MHCFTTWFLTASKIFVVERIEPTLYDYDTVKLNYHHKMFSIFRILLTANKNKRTHIIFKPLKRYQNLCKHYSWGKDLHRHTKQARDDKYSKRSLSIIWLSFHFSNCIRTLYTKHPSNVELFWVSISFCHCSCYSIYAYIYVQARKFILNSIQIYR